MTYLLGVLLKLLSMYSNPCVLDLRTNLRDSDGNEMEHGKFPD